MLARKARGSPAGQRGSRRGSGGLSGILRRAKLRYLQAPCQLSPTSIPPLLALWPAQLQSRICLRPRSRAQHSSLTINGFKNWRRREQLLSNIDPCEEDFQHRAVGQQTCLGIRSLALGTTERDPINSNSLSHSLFFQLRSYDSRTASSGDRSRSR